MSSNISNQSTFLIPKSIKTKNAEFKYKSPQPSPITLRTNSKPTHRVCDSFKENCDLSNFASNHSKKSSTNPSANHKPLESLSSGNDNVLNLEDFIQKFHPALTQNNSESLRQQIEKLANNNKSLKEMIRTSENELAQRLLENSNKITKNIQKTQNEIDALETHCISLKKEANSQENEEIKLLVSENKTLSDSIDNIQAKINNYKQKGIKHEQFSILQDNIIELESVQESLIHQNSGLKKELNSQQVSNSSSKACSDYALNMKNLKILYSQINKLEKIAKKYIANEAIRLNEIIDFEEDIPPQSMPSLITMIKKQLGSLRVLVSDIYAENCGDECLSQ